MDEKKWYMITTISGKEEQVIDALKHRINSEGLQEQFDDLVAMMIPTISPKELTKKLAGQKFRAKYKNLFPGYVFIKMQMSNEAWFIVRNTQYVTGLVGSSGQRTKPSPIAELEINKMREQVAKIKADFDAGIVITEFVPGVIVVVNDGPHKGQVGPILESDDAKGLATIELILFNRKTPVTIEHKFLEIKNA